MNENYVMVAWSQGGTTGITVVKAGLANRAVTATAQTSALAGTEEAEGTSHPLGALLIASMGILKLFAVRFLG